MKYFLALLFLTLCGSAKAALPTIPKDQIGVFEKKYTVLSMRTVAPHYILVIARDRRDNSKWNTNQRPLKLEGYTMLSDVTPPDQGPALPKEYPSSEKNSTSLMTFLFAFDTKSRKIIWCKRHIWPSTPEEGNPQDEYSTKAIKFYRYGKNYLYYCHYDPDTPLMNISRRKPTRITQIAYKTGETKTVVLDGGIESVALLPQDRFFVEYRKKIEPKEPAAASPAPPPHPAMRHTETQTSLHKVVFEAASFSLPGKMSQDIAPVATDAMPPPPIFGSFSNSSQRVRTTKAWDRSALPISEQSYVAGGIVADSQTDQIKALTYNPMSNDLFSFRNLIDEMLTDSAYYRNLKKGGITEYHSLRESVLYGPWGRCPGTASLYFPTHHFVVSLRLSTGSRGSAAIRGDKQILYISPYAPIGVALRPIRTDVNNLRVQCFDLIQGAKLFFVDLIDYGSEHCPVQVGFGEDTLLISTHHYFYIVPIPKELLAKVKRPFQMEYPNLPPLSMSQVATVQLQCRGTTGAVRYKLVGSSEQHSSSNPSKTIAKIFHLEPTTGKLMINTPALWGQLVQEIRYSSTRQLDDLEKNYFSSIAWDVEMLWGRQLPPTVVPFAVPLNIEATAQDGQQAALSVRPVVLAPRANLEAMITAQRKRIPTILAWAQKRLDAKMAEYARKAKEAGREPRISPNPPRVTHLTKQTILDYETAHANQ